MQIFVPKELKTGETRVPVIPPTIEKLVKAGADIAVESGIGEAIGLTDDAYTAVGAKVTSDRDGSLSSADIVIRLNKPSPEEVKQLKPGCIHISYVDPFNSPELVKAFAQAGINAISMEMIPRTTLAQKMDALSSQANLAGYVAVVIAAERLTKVLPMMVTPSGTINPARVFIIGAGVAGLQAIATAKRLGARVDAFDTRPVVEEQVKSLGARFVKVDLGETGQTKDGYAKALTEEQLQKQRDAMAKYCSQADIVITTAQVFGRKAPVIVTEDMVAGMQPGSIIVDMAVETGGNVVGSKLGEEVDVNGVKVIGLANLPGQVPVASSQMYSNNVGALLEHFWDKEAKVLKLDLEDEIMDGALIVQNNEVRNEMIKTAIAQ
ncbi:MAG: Re/Si-specific NAD(P)(+) transhydrogenase subunit alpha [Verrucomicrobia bacterium]|nr:Re/Si-specific NAD(P)(+) transhydrogenase subunit alpha [Verrucomicrobiota bacterium]